MSYLYLGKTKHGHCILDTTDLVTDTLTDTELNKIRDMRIQVRKFNKQTAQLGVETIDNKYSIYINGYPNPIYNGEFPTQCNRNDIFGFDIKVADVGIMLNRALIAIICDCWVKYDIEVPMVMCQIIQIPFNNFSCGCCISVATKQPIYFSEANVCKRQYEECHGDFPDKYVKCEDCIIEIKEKSMNVFGHTYKESVPYYDYVDNKLTWFHI